MDKDWFYQRNDYLLNSEYNVCFEDVLTMTDNQFRDFAFRFVTLASTGRPSGPDVDFFAITRELSGVNS